MTNWLQLCGGRPLLLLQNSRVVGVESSGFVGVLRGRNKRFSVPYSEGALIEIYIGRQYFFSGSCLSIDPATAATKGTSIVYSSSQGLTLSGVLGSSAVTAAFQRERLLSTIILRLALAYQDTYSRFA